MVGQEAAGFIHPIKCDSKGNVYARFSPPFGNYMASPVTKISPDGEVQAVFRIETAPGFGEDATFDDFGIDPRGNVHLLTTKVTGEPGQPQQVENVIVRYDSSGKYDSSITLPRALGIAQVAVFPSGEFLVSGDKKTKIGDQLQSTGEVFTALFDRQGRLIKELRLPEDIQGVSTEEHPGGAPSTQQPEASARAPQNPGAAKLSAEQFSRAVSTGMAVPSDDGNIYIMRATPNPLVFAISPSGQVVRRLQLMAPSGDAYPVSIQVAAGKIVILYVEREPSGKFKRHLFAVANAETGETLAHYLDTPEIGGALACYTPDGFVFLGNKGSQLLLLRAAPY